ncbi:hypothetical protein HK102_010017 [Quaeritorhiza haematococci]|nr:hypothetical protein HK102_010017 [Quaeritorhiza haematococci]
MGLWDSVAIRSYSTTCRPDGQGVGSSETSEASSTSATSSVAAGPTASPASVGRKSSSKTSRIDGRKLPKHGKYASGGRKVRSRRKATQHLPATKVKPAQAVNASRTTQVTASTTMLQNPGSISSLDLSKSSSTSSNDVPPSLRRALARWPDITQSFTDPERFPYPIDIITRKQLESLATVTLAAGPTTAGRYSSKILPGLKHAVLTCPHPGATAHLEYTVRALAAEFGANVVALDYRTILSAAMEIREREGVEWEVGSPVTFSDQAQQNSIPDLKLTPAFAPSDYKELSAVSEEYREDVDDDDFASKKPTTRDGSPLSSMPKPTEDEALENDEDENDDDEFDDVDMEDMDDSYDEFFHAMSSGKSPLQELGISTGTTYVVADVEQRQAASNPSTPRNSNSRLIPPAGGKISSIDNSGSHYDITIPDELLHKTVNAIGDLISEEVVKRGKGGQEPQPGASKPRFIIYLQDTTDLLLHGKQNGVKVLKTLMNMVSVIQNKKPDPQTPNPFTSTPDGTPALNHLVGKVPVMFIAGCTPSLVDKENLTKKVDFYRDMYSEFFLSTGPLTAQEPIQTSSLVRLWEEGGPLFATPLDGMNREFEKVVISPPAPVFALMSNVGDWDARSSSSTSTSTRSFLSALSAAGTDRGVIPAILPSSSSTTTPPSSTLTSILESADLALRAWLHQVEEDQRWRIRETNWRNVEAVCEAWGLHVRGSDDVLEGPPWGMYVHGGAEVKRASDEKEASWVVPRRHSQGTFKIPPSDQKLISDMLEREVWPMHKIERLVSLAVAARLKVGRGIRCSVDPLAPAIPPSRALVVSSGASKTLGRGRIRRSLQTPLRWQNVSGRTSTTPSDEKLPEITTEGMELPEFDADDTPAHHRPPLDLNLSHFCEALSLIDGTDFARNGLRVINHLQNSNLVDTENQQQKSGSGPGSVDALASDAIQASVDPEGVEAGAVEHSQQGNVCDKTESGDSTRGGGGKGSGGATQNAAGAAPGKGKTPSQSDMLRNLKKQLAAKGLSTHEKRILNTVVDPAVIPVTFSDLVLPPPTKLTLQTLVTLPLLRPEHFATGILGRYSISGVLLFGPPGTGKTMLAKAVAKSGGARFMGVSLSDIFDKYVGEGEKNVRAVFRLARKLSPCVVFLDEVDALFGTRRNDGSPSRREVINEFMNEWDGLTSNNTGVIVMAATNRPFDLDDAILRRMPRRILVDLPNEEQRQRILELHLRDETLDSSVSTADLAKQTHLYSGSDLKNLCVAAALTAVKEQVLREALGVIDNETAVDASSSNETSENQKEYTPAELLKKLEKIEDWTEVVSGRSGAGVGVGGVMNNAKTADSNPTAGPSTTTSSSASKPHQRILTAEHFDIAFREVPPSLTDEMETLVALRKWDKMFGDAATSRRGAKKGWGFEVSPSGGSIVQGAASFVGNGDIVPTTTTVPSMRRRRT